MLVLRAALFMPLLHVRGGADGTVEVGGSAKPSSRCSAAPRDVGREEGDLGAQGF